MKRVKSKIYLISERLVIIVVVIVVTAIVVRALDNESSDRLADNDSLEQCEENMVYVSSAEGGFCIDKYEASVSDKCPYDSPGSQRESRLNVDYKDCMPIVRAGAVPWRFISQNQAAMACAKAGKRLPTNKEWQLAAWATPDIASGWGKEDCQVAGNWTDQPGAAGSGSRCVSSAGAFDMIGNVWEWIDGTTFEGKYKSRELPESGFVLGIDDEAMPSETDAINGDPNYYFDYFWLKESGTRGIARGGYWDNKEEAGQYALYAVSPPSYAGAGVGFRCVK